MRLPKPGTKGHKLTSAFALIWIGLLAGLGAPEAYRQVHDHYTLQPCAEEFLAANQDRDIASDHFPTFPPDQGIQPIFRYALDFETAFRDRVVALDCPTTVEDDLAELAFRSGLLLKYLETIIDDPNQYDAFFVGIRIGEVNRARNEVISAIAELMPPVETNPSPSSS